MWPAGRSVWPSSRSVWPAGRSVWLAGRSVWPSSRSVWPAGRSVWLAGRSVWLAGRSVCPAGHFETDPSVWGYNVPVGSLHIDGDINLAGWVGGGVVGFVTRTRRGWGSGQQGPPCNSR